MGAGAAAAWAAGAAAAAVEAGRTRGAQPSHGSNREKKKLLGSATSAPRKSGGIGTATPPCETTFRPAFFTASTSASMPWVRNCTRVAPRSWIRIFSGVRSTPLNSTNSNHMDEFLAFARARRASAFGRPVNSRAALSPAKGVSPSTVKPRMSR